MKQQSVHSFIGLQQDLDPLKHPANLLDDAYNIRITAREDGTLLSITNEVGPERIDPESETSTPIILLGKYLGHCVLNKYLVLFTTCWQTNADAYTVQDEDFKKDYIYRINLDTNQVRILYQGQLKFNTDHPIEAFGDYETDLIQKVYWTDGYNQPRMINIIDTNRVYDDYSFDFVQPLALNETVAVTKEFSANGLFAPGAIQYAFTYYNLYGPETNIFYITPLYYVSFNDRGGSPEDKVENAFKITISNLDKRFDFVRIYSIQRTSINATPIVKRLQDITTNILTKTRQHSLKYIESFWFRREYHLSPNFYFTYEGCTKYNKDSRFENWRNFNDFNSVRDGGDPPLENGYIHTPEQGGHNQYPIDYFRLSPSQYPNLKIKVMNDQGEWKEYEVTSTIYVAYIPTPFPKTSSTYEGEAKIIVCPEHREGEYNLIHYYMERDGYTMDNYYNGAPPLQDVESEIVPLSEVVYIDDGKNGDIVDPESLYYKGGESILAETMTTKDNTLFLGNIFINRPIINSVNISEIQQYTNISCDRRNVYPHKVSGDPYPYWNFLTTYIDAEDSALTNAAGFKRNEIYRLGVQFQHYTGMWSQPIWIENNSNDTVDGQTLKDWIQTGIPNQDSLNPDVFKIPIFQATFNNGSAKHALQQIKEQGYIKARPVVVFPTINDRRVVMQGITAPTVYRESDRHGVDVLDRERIEGAVQSQNLFRLDSSAHGSIHAQSSWFFRPYNNCLDLLSQETVHITTGQDPVNAHFQNLYDITSQDQGETTITSYNASFLEDYYLPQFPMQTHNYPGDEDSIFEQNKFIYPDVVTPNTANIQRGCEVQGLYSFYDAFRVDGKFVTFHSPDIIFDDNTWSMDYSNCVAQCVGYCRFKRTLGDIDIKLKTAPLQQDGGFIHKQMTIENDSGINNKCLCGGWFYHDYVADDWDEGDALPVKPLGKENVPISWFIYPWQKSGSLNNDFTWGSHLRAAELQTKVISNLKYADTNFANDNPITIKGIPQIVKDDFIHAIKTDDKIYFPNIDKVLTPNYQVGSIVSTGYSIDNSSLNEVENITTMPQFVSTIWQWHIKNWRNNKPVLLRATGSNSNYVIWKKKPYDTYIGKYNKNYVTNRESVLMRYRSTPHMVMSTDGVSIYQTNQIVGALPLAEIRKLYNPLTHFGGFNPDTLQANVWLPAGEPINIDDLLSGRTLDFIYGDTWYQRFDCLKTYPYSYEDPNQIVEIGSFMVETRVNIDGRYDKNRGLVSNVYIGPTNFNLYNPVYNQQNNFFTYKIIDERFTQSDRFTNQITWSLEKHPASEIDVWTQTTLASTHNLNGTCGEIRYLNTWNGNIFCFQDTGISNILFNSRVQIPVSDGVPVEITNGYKVDGERYISDTMGSINKYTITPTPRGIYFIDTNSKILNIIGSQGIQPISTAKNMQIWFNGLTPEKWTASNYTTKSFYDSYNEDLYICTPDKALCFSERLDQFTSFMSYGEADAIFNACKNVYALHTEDVGYSAQVHYPTVRLYKMFAGTPNRYFEEDFQPFYITFISNGLGEQRDLTLMDKTFTNVHIQSDRWNGKYESLATEERGTEDVIVNKPPFDYIRVQDEYQDTGSVYLNRSICKPDNLKSKFRMWNAVIPRDKDRKLDRIRNPWCKIKLTSNEPDGCRVNLHNIAVDFLI